MSVAHNNIEKYDFDSFEKEQLPFTMIPNQVIQKTPHEFIKPVFLWVYLQSLPKDWTINKNQIMNHFGISERTYQRWMSWLNASSLIEYRQNRNKDGSFGEWKLVVLNGTKFSPDALSNRSAKIGGVDIHRSAKKPLNGVAVATVNGDIKKTTLPTKENKNTTTTTASSCSTEFISFKPADDPRTDQEFLKQCEFHINSRDKTKFTKAQAIKGLIKILTNGTFETPVGYKLTTKETESQRMKRYALERKKWFDH